MVVGYKLKPFSYWLAQWLVKTDYVSPAQPAGGQDAGARTHPARVHPGQPWWKR